MTGQQPGHMMHATEERQATAEALKRMLGIVEPPDDRPTHAAEHARLVSEANEYGESGNRFMYIVARAKADEYAATHGLT